MRAGGCFCAFLAFLFACAMPVCAWDKGGKSGGSHGRSPAQAIHGAGHRISESVHKGADQAIQNVREGVRQGKERFDALSTQVQHGVADSNAHLKKSAALSYQEIKRASSRVLIAEYKRRLTLARCALASNSQGSSGQLRESMRDEAARERALGAAALVAASVGIAALKAIAVFDSDAGRLVTLDALVRAAVAALGAGEAGDFGRDPIAALPGKRMVTPFQRHGRLRRSTWSCGWVIRRPGIRGGGSHPVPKRRQQTQGGSLRPFCC